MGHSWAWLISLTLTKGVRTTRHCQTSGRLVQELKVCIVGADPDALRLVTCLPRPDSNTSFLLDSNHCGKLEWAFKSPYSIEYVKVYR